MTKLSGVVKREVVSPTGEAYIITLTAEGVVMREKGRRTQFGPLSYGFLHQTAVSRTVIADDRRQVRTKRVTRSLI